MLTRPWAPVQSLKVDLSDGFYRVNLNIDDIPKLGFVFPTKPAEPQMVAFPLVFFHGVKKHSPNFHDGNQNYFQHGQP